MVDAVKEGLNSAFLPRIHAGAIESRGNSTIQTLRGPVPGIVDHHRVNALSFTAQAFPSVVPSMMTKKTNGYSKHFQRYHCAGSSAHPGALQHANHQSAFPLKSL